MKTGNLLIIDCETTGLSPDKNDKCIEVGAILWNINEMSMLQCLSTLLPCESNPVEHINHITPALTKCSYYAEEFFLALEAMGMASDAIIAHNAQFDYKFLQTIKDIHEPFWLIPWICTKQDIKWPIELSRKRLKDICEAFEISYADSHRSLKDCSLLASCLSHVPDLKEQIEKLITK